MKKKRSNGDRWQNFVTKVTLVPRQILIVAYQRQEPPFDRIGFKCRGSFGAVGVLAQAVRILMAIS